MRGRRLATAVNRMFIFQGYFCSSSNAEQKAVRNFFADSGQHPGDCRPKLRRDTAQGPIRHPPGTYRYAGYRVKLTRQLRRAAESGDDVAISHARR